MIVQNDKLVTKTILKFKLFNEKYKMDYIFVIKY